MSDQLCPEKFVQNAQICTKYCTNAFGGETRWGRLQRSPKVPSWIKGEGMRGEGRRKEGERREEKGRKEGRYSPSFRSSGYAHAQTGTKKCKPLRKQCRKKNNALLIHRIWVK